METQTKKKQIKCDYKNYSHRSKCENGVRYGEGSVKAQKCMYTFCTAPKGFLLSIEFLV